VRAGGRPAAGPYHQKTRVREAESSGMLCSARELGLSEESSGLLALPEDAPVGADIRKYLELDDKIFTLKLTPTGPTA